MTVTFEPLVVPEKDPSATGVDTTQAINKATVALATVARMRCIGLLYQQRILPQGSEIARRLNSGEWDDLRDEVLALMTAAFLEARRVP